MWIVTRESAFAIVSAAKEQHGTSADVLHALLLFASPLGKRHGAARGQATTEQREERRNRKSEAWVVLAEEHHEDHQGERQNESTGKDPGHRQVRICQTQSVTCRSGLEKRVQRSVRPFPKTTLRRQLPFHAKRRA